MLSEILKQVQDDGLIERFRILKQVQDDALIEQFRSPAFICFHKGFTNKLQSMRHAKFISASDSLLKILKQVQDDALIERFRIPAFICFHKKDLPIKSNQFVMPNLFRHLTHF